MDVLRDPSYFCIVFNSQSNHICVLKIEQGFIKLTDVVMLYCLMDDPEVLLIYMRDHTVADGIVSDQTFLIRQLKVPSMVLEGWVVLLDAWDRLR